MTLPDDLARPLLPGAPPANGPRGEPRAPDRAGVGPDLQWAEAYRLFDGEYHSLDDLLRTLAD